MLVLQQDTVTVHGPATASVKAPVREAQTVKAAEATSLQATQSLPPLPAMTAADAAWDRATATTHPVLLHFLHLLLHNHQQQQPLLLLLLLRTQVRMLQACTQLGRMSR